MWRKHLEITIHTTFLPTHYCSRVSSQFVPLGGHIGDVQRGVWEDEGLSGHRLLGQRVLIIELAIFQVDSLPVAVSGG